MQIYAPQQSASSGQRRTGQQAVDEYQRRTGRAVDAQSVNQFKQASGWSGQGDLSDDQYRKGMASFGFSEYLGQTRGGGPEQPGQARPQGSPGQIGSNPGAPNFEMPSREQMERMKQEQGDRRGQWTRNASGQMVFQEHDPSHNRMLLSVPQSAQSQQQPQVAQGGMDPGQAAAQFQSMYGRAPTPQDIQRFQSASGWSGQGNISQQQYQQGMQAMSGFMQQEGNLGAVPLIQPGQPGQMQSVEASRQQGQQLVGQYQPSQQAQQLQGQAGQTVTGLMQGGPSTFQAPGGQQANYTQQQQLVNQMQGMQQGPFQAPTGGPTPDFTQQQQLIGQLQGGQAPQTNQALMQQQRGAINQIQGMQAGPFQAPEAVAQAERNRVLAAVIGQPEVFGATQQAQMAEQQKEQLGQQARESENRLAQLMASRGLSARGGQDLLGQLDIQRDLQSNLLAGQRDIALRAAEANRASQLGAIQAVTGAQQADMARAAQGFQTGLEGQRFNLGAQQTAAQLAGQAGAQEFGQALAGAEFTRGGQQAALAGQQNLAGQQMALNQQNYQQALGGFGANLQANQFNLGAQQAALAGAAGLGQQQFSEGLQAFQANLGAQGQFGQQQLNAAQLANQMGQQGFQNYLAQQQLGLQGFGAAEQAAAARAQFNQGNYMDALRYNLGARGQEQNYGLGLRNLGLNEQELMSSLYGFRS
jgi:hypothetical protein